MVNRGDIWLVTLDPTVGREIQKTRPCVIVSPPEMNRYLQTVLAAPMTSGGRAAPFRIAVEFQQKQSLILLDQLRALDKTRLVKKMGTLPDATLCATLATLQDVFSEH